jgi:hypothetical protein
MVIEILADSAFRKVRGAEPAVVERRSVKSTMVGRKTLTKALLDKERDGERITLPGYGSGVLIQP